MTTSDRPLGLENVEIVTISEAAKILGIVPERVRLFMNQGRLRAIKAGRDWVTTRAEVEAFAKIDRRPGKPGHWQSKESD